MQSAPDLSASLPAAAQLSQSPLLEARRARAEIVHVATWLRGIWGDDDELPPFEWSTLSAVPAWALGVPAQLERLALLTGALVAAPALRLCLDAGPLMRVRALIGAAAFDRVLALSDPQIQSPEWPADERDERNTLYTWGAALLAGSVGDPMLQATVIRVLSLSPAMVRRGLPPVSLAVQMTTLANKITDALSSAVPVNDGFDRVPHGQPAMAAGRAMA
jgi:hypothetical protein